MLETVRIHAVAFSQAELESVLANLDHALGPGDVESGASTRHGHVQTLARAALCYLGPEGLQQHIIRDRSATRNDQVPHHPLCHAPIPGAVVDVRAAPPDLEAAEHLEGERR